MYQPMALTPLQVPGSRRGSPSLPSTGLPVMGLPDRLILPFSRMSKAMLLALRTEAVLRLTL